MIKFININGVETYICPLCNKETVLIMLDNYDKPIYSWRHREFRIIGINCGLIKDIPADKFEEFNSTNLSIFKSDIEEYSKTIMFKRHLKNLIMKNL